MFDKILVAIDLLIKPAQRVLERAASLKSAPLEMFVTHVVESQYVQYSIDPTFTGSLTRAMEENALAAARTRVAEICKPYGIPDDHQLITLGRAADRIHALAREREVDTIVVGSHVRPGIKRLLGSTANAVLHGSPVNVVIIRNPDGESTWP
ncbi:MAG: universal stress protein [Pseudomonadales bacterium]